MNKGFTLVELLGVIVVLTILTSLAIISFTAVIENGRKGVYKNYETTLQDAGRNYLIENTSQRPIIGTSITVTYEILNNGHFIDEMPDPKGGNCNQSKVIITRGPDRDNNYNLTYKACLICSHYRSTGC